ncbi:F-box/WD repeat-containing protein 10 isoform X6 [Physeter macrocephalus]|uniref:F-box/WD repeat-containing protein 10 isoform X6 n=1 Tax=Physeter macrocephalus TaxID=9755 RepID=A0A455C396_PHYMC|nr:F-box/WD repeat-containing protein 10 isoform X6 [Physeter catodon]|eukprot:XP_028355805.1 F-box/WD repeat-containing protein 10 isoform X6 [Physeter catodon]
MENTESRLQNAPYFRCEKGNSSVPVCQKCETCVLAWKIFSTEEWFRRVGKMSQRRFLVSILQQLDSLYLLHYFQNILQTTQGKDFVYHRSRVNLSKKEGKIVKSPLNQMLDKTVEQKMREILYWFGNSSYRTKANYTLLLLQMCDPELLLTAVDVIRVLFLRGRNDASGNDPDSKDVFFVPEKGHTPPCETSQVCWAARPGHTSFPLSKTTGKASLHENVWWGAATTEGQWKSSLRYISEMNRLSSEKASVSEAGSAPAADVLVDLEAVRELSSGVSRYRDFIRHLPVHLAKYILSTRGLLGDFSGPRPPPSQRSWEVPRSTSCFPGMLDKNSLNRCVFVNQHWAVLAQQVKTDLSMHSFIQHQITFLQGSYTRGIDPNYASKVTIPVPKMADDGKHLCVKNQKRKLRTKNDYDLWTAYQNQETQQVQMEERNVFCGTYNIRILSDMWDRNRVIHYSGGDLLAVSSNRKIQLLDIIQIKQIPIKFRGHTGSVRTLFLCEEENFLLSGSYDLSIREVLHVALLFLRVISACADGKIRIYNFLNGNCLKVMKASGRGYPVLSFFIQGNRMVINTESNVLMFQFENIKWQYSLERAKQKKKDKEEDREANGLAEVLSKSSTQIYSPRESISSKQTAQESLFSKSHRSRVLLRASRLPTGVLTEAPLSQGKPKSPRRDGRKRLSSREANGTGTEQENLEAKPLAGDKKNDDVEKIPEQGQLGTLGDLINCSKKKSWCIRMSPDQFLLTVNALQRAHNSGEFAYPRRPQTQVIDAWGPSISYPRKVLSLKGRSVQHAVDRLRLSNPPIDVKQTSIPLEIQKLQPNLKNSVHSPRVQSTIPQPVLICPRFSGSLRGEDPATSSADGAARSFSPLTSTQVIKRNHILAPPMGTTAQAAKKDRSRFYTALDPFRVNTEFMLLTVKEEKEYEEAKMKEFQAIKPAGGVDPEKASRAAWIRKIKGLPIDNFMKQGKTAAPELGQNVFI